MKGHDFSTVVDIGAPCVPVIATGLLLANLANGQDDSVAFWDSTSGTEETGAAGEKPVVRDKLAVVAAPDEKGHRLAADAGRGRTEVKTLRKGQPEEAAADADRGRAI